MDNEHLKKLAGLPITEDYKVATAWDADFKAVMALLKQARKISSSSNWSKYLHMLSDNAVRDPAYYDRSEKAASAVFHSLEQAEIDLVELLDEVKALRKRQPKAPKGK